MLIIFVLLEFSFFDISWVKGDHVHIGTLIEEKPTFENN